MNDVCLFVCVYVCVWRTTTTTSANVYQMATGIVWKGWKWAWQPERFSVTADWPFRPHLHPHLEATRGEEGWKEQTRWRNDRWIRARKAGKRWEETKTDSFHQNTTPTKLIDSRNSFRETFHSTRTSQQIESLCPSKSQNHWEASRAKMYTQTDIAERERTVKEFDVLLVGKKKASPLKSIRDPLRRKIKLLLERTAGLAEAAAAVAAITVASACRPPTITSQPPKREAFSW